MTLTFFYNIILVLNNFLDYYITELTEAEIIDLRLNNNLIFKQINNKNIIFLKKNINQINIFLEISQLFQHNSVNKIFLKIDYYVNDKNKTFILSQFSNNLDFEDINKKKNKMSKILEKEVLFKINI